MLSQIILYHFTFSMFIVSSGYCTLLSVFIFVFAKFICIIIMKGPSFMQYLFIIVGLELCKSYIFAECFGTFLFVELRYPFLASFRHFHTHTHTRYPTHTHTRTSVLRKQTARRCKKRALGGVLKTGSKTSSPKKKRGILKTIWLTRFSMVFFFSYWIEFQL